MKEVLPILSLRERDRRYRLVREWMKMGGLDCLIVAGLSGEQIDGYFNNDSANAIVVFPLEGEPIYLVWAASRIVRKMEYARRGGTSWIEDYRVGATGAGLVAALQEKGFNSASIGVMGVDTRAPGQLEGWVPYMTWSYVLDHLRHATFTNVTFPLGELMLVKSDEELALVRRCAQIGEMACQAQLEVTKPGTNECEIYASILKVIFASGAGVRSHILVMQTGVDNLSWGEPMWLHQAQRPNFIQRGELVATEIFVLYGGLEVQQSMTVALKPVDSMNQECAEVAQKVYKVGLKALSPGKRFSEVVNAMERAVAEAGCWHMGTLIHTLNPELWLGPSNVGIDQMPGIEKYKGVEFVGEKRTPDFVIKPGMVFSLEPKAFRGKYRVSVGGSVIVTEEGAEELNKLPTELHVVD